MAAIGTQSDDVIVTHHAADRWDQRTPTDSVSPEAAWSEASTMSHPGYPFNTFDELRYHRGTETVLCQDSVRLVTVYNLREQPDRILREAVSNQFGVSFGQESPDPVEFSGEP